MLGHDYLPAFVHKSPLVSLTGHSTNLHVVLKLMCIPDRSNNIMRFTHTPPPPPKKKNKNKKKKQKTKKKTAYTPGKMNVLEGINGINESACVSIC